MTTSNDTSGAGRSEARPLDESADTLEAEWSLSNEFDDLTRRILVVDDERHILKAVRRLFAGREFELITAEDASKALELLGQQTVSVLIADQRMPGMTGIELLDYARNHFPTTVRMMLTGNNDVSTAIKAINEGEVFRFVTKPWDHDNFVRIVDLALEQYELQASKERYEDHIESQNDELRSLNRELRQLNGDLEDRVKERTREVRESNRKISRLYSELQDSFDGMIKALLCIMELGDIQVVEHCQRTAERVVMFAEYLGFDDTMVRELERAALLHWLGLINASPALIGKDLDAFDAVEEATWEFHPLLGQQAIRHVPALHEAGRLVLHYLSRHDDPEFAPGEPSSDEGGQLLDDEFIDACQVLAICSFFERVKTARNNGDGRCDFIEEGLDVIDARSGGRFDPELVDEFKEMMGDRLATSGNTQVVVGFEKLEPGMVLARPLETAHGIPVAPRDMIITEELIERLERFRDSKGLGEIYVWD